MPKETVLAICAHNDDHILGVGGTLAKYAKEGKRFITIIFSYGESSHPWLKKEITKEMRLKESLEAEKILGGTTPIYLDINEGKFKKNKPKIKKIIKQLIEKYKPAKIFTHSLDDPHPDHRAVHNIVLEVTDRLSQKPEVYMFSVWNLISIRKRNLPKLVVDITKTYNLKIKAFQAHKSQKITFLTLIWDVYRKALIDGFKNRCRYAEVFYKIR